MYEEFYGLKDRPFSITPNPRFIFYSDRYRSALEHLLYGLEHREGFMLLVGAVGAGKTTACRVLLEHLSPERYNTALIFDPFLSAAEMLESLLTEYKVAFPARSSRKELLDRLNAYLLEQYREGRTCVAIFDEAQHLSPEFLEQIRVLSNLETEQEKLLQIMLSGQPELKQRIQQPSLAQLDQRVTLRCTLTSLDRDQVEQYVYHRLNVAGAQGRITFTKRALRKIHKETQGIPRLINLVCDRSLLSAYVARTALIDINHVTEGVLSLKGEDAVQEGTLLGKPRSRWPQLTAIAALVAVIVLGAVYWYIEGRPG